MPHRAIFLALAAYGAGSHPIEVVQDLYSDISTVFRCPDGFSDPLVKHRGVLQGDPISGILFNVALDPVLWCANPTHLQRTIIAYADDVTPFATSPDLLQERINNVVSSAKRIGLSLNPTKCKAFHLVASENTGSRETQFFVDGVPIRSIGDGEHVKYLGKPVGFLHEKISSLEIADLQSMAVKILDSKLAYWQKLDALKTFFYPALVFSHRTIRFAKTTLNTLDESLRPLLKKLFGLPQRAGNPFLYGPFKKGSAGLPLLAEEADIFAIDTAFKILTSKDP